MFDIIFIVIGYALGSVNTAILVCKAMGLKDPRSEGSKNPGASNVYRLAGKQAAAIVVLADFFKGTLAIWLASMMGMSTFTLGLVAAGATAGHIFPAFFEFKGGKGAATCLGACFGVCMPLGILLVGIWAGIVYVKKMASLASLIACAAAPLLLIFTGSRGAFIGVAIAAGLVIWRHKDNIQRLKDGTETKLEF